MTPIRKLLGMFFIVVFVVVWCILAFRGGPVEHIEDTNGDDNYKLQVINDGNIISRDIGAKGFSSTTNNITNSTVYSSKKYTGVTEVDGYTSIGNSHTVYVNYFDVYAGNAKLVVLKDDVIVHEFAPNEGVQDFTVENAKGAYISIRLAGESANFKLDIN
ncbi:MAG: hypothetical protein IKV21_00335 [Clostridia bacterium]|nr:hypothetical protein [Clostridia bacterium]